METKKRKVASFFIENVPGHGIVVGNVGETVRVPVSHIKDWQDRGLIAKKGDDAAEGDDNQPVALKGKTKPQLLAIAADEKVTIEDGATNADIVAAIELAREDAAKKGDDADVAP